MGSLPSYPRIRLSRGVFFMADDGSGRRLLCQGAEGRVFTTTFLGKRAVVKERFPKKYRQPDLDRSLTKRRLINEARCILRCRRAGVDTPTIFFVDLDTNRLYMEFVEGMTAKEYIQRVGHDEMATRTMAKRIGCMLAQMHDAEVVHGDLTTSNILVRPSGSLVLLDFGLSQTSALAEDMAVDLFVLERAFLSTHPNSQSLFDSMLKVYIETSKKSIPVMQKLEHVRMRGRKKLPLG